MKKQETKKETSLNALNNEKNISKSNNLKVTDWNFRCACVSVRDQLYTATTFHFLLTTKTYINLTSYAQATLMMCYMTFVFNDMRITPVLPLELIINARVCMCVFISTISHQE